MSRSAYVPLTATAAKEAAENNVPLEIAWFGLAETLPESINIVEREALCDIFRRSYYVARSLHQGDAEAEKAAEPKA